MKFSRHITQVSTGLLKQKVVFCIASQNDNIMFQNYV